MDIPYVPPSHLLINQLKEYYRQQLKPDPDSYNLKLSELMERAQQELKEYNEQKETKERLTEVMFLTITSYEDIPFKTWLAVLDSWTTRVYVKDYIYVIEQRGTNADEVGKGFHAHVLFRHNDKSYANLVRNLRSTFKKACDTTSTTWFKKLNIKCCKTQQDVINRLQYMIGTKKEMDGHNKAIKQEYDIVFRQQVKLDPHYTNTDYYINLI